jgi:hypothetical protein
MENIVKYGDKKNACRRCGKKIEEFYDFRITCNFKKINQSKDYNGVHDGLVLPLCKDCVKNIDFIFEFFR